MTAELRDPAPPDAVEVDGVLPLTVAASAFALQGRAFATRADGRPPPYDLRRLHLLFEEPRPLVGGWPVEPTEPFTEAMAESISGLVKCESLVFSGDYRVRFVSAKDNGGGVVVALRWRNRDWALATAQASSGVLNALQTRVLATCLTPDVRYDAPYRGVTVSLRPALSGTCVTGFKAASPGSVVVREGRCWSLDFEEPAPRFMGRPVLCDLPALQAPPEGCYCVCESLNLDAAWTAEWVGEGPSGAVLVRQGDSLRLVGHAHPATKRMNSLCVVPAFDDSADPTVYTWDGDPVCFPETRIPDCAFYAFVTDPELSNPQTKLEWVSLGAPRSGKAALLARPPGCKVALVGVSHAEDNIWSTTVRMDAFVPAFARKSDAFVSWKETYERLGPAWEHARAFEHFFVNSRPADRVAAAFELLRSAHPAELAPHLEEIAAMQTRAENERFGELSFSSRVR